MLLLWLLAISYTYSIYLQPKHDASTTTLGSEAQHALLPRIPSISWFLLPVVGLHDSCTTGLISQNASPSHDRKSQDGLRLQTLTVRPQQIFERVLPALPQLCGVSSF